MGKKKSNKKQVLYRIINNTNTIYLIILLFRLIFIFSESNNSNQSFSENINKQKEIYTNTETTVLKPNLHYSANGDNSNNYNKIQEIQIEQIQEEDIEQQNYKTIQENMNLSSNDINKIDINKIRNNLDQSILEDITILENMYKETQNISIQRVLIEKLIQDYQFDKAYEHSKNIIELSGYNILDPHLVLYTILNSSEISVLNENSINKINPILEEYKTRGIISADDYRFYQSLIQMRSYNYDGALVLLQQISSPRYNTIKNKLIEIKNSVSQQKDMPSYYQDGLISLMLLKNGYFNIAKKISINILNKNDKYILPYQVLAYSHFVTNNRATATEYLLKLIEIDNKNTNIYKFIIGISYYREGKYEQSTLYLFQVESNIVEYNRANTKNDVLTTDVYRYILLNYIGGNDKIRMINLWQKMLGENNLQKFDFYTYFYHAFYKPITNGDNYTIYNNNKRLSEDFVSRCYTMLSREDHDVCIYGHAGIDFLNDRSTDAKNKLLYLAKNYPQSYIFHALGDYFYKQGQFIKAKTYYLKATSLTKNLTEENILKTKLLESSI